MERTTISTLQSGYATDQYVVRKFEQFRHHFPQMQEKRQIYVLINMESRVKVREYDFLSANGFFPANLAYLANGSLVIVFKPFDSERQWAKTIRKENIEYLLQAITH